MISLRNDIHIPVLVTSMHDACDVYVPDLNITVHGKDYVDALANAMLKASAIYYYNKERNLSFPLETTYEQVEKMCKGRKQFATFIELSA